MMNTSHKCDPPSPPSPSGPAILYYYLLLYPYIYRVYTHSKRCRRLVFIFFFHNNNSCYTSDVWNSIYTRYRYYYYYYTSGTRVEKPHVKNSIRVILCTDFADKEFCFKKYRRRIIVVFFFCKDRKDNVVC